MKMLLSKTLPPTYERLVKILVVVVGVTGRADTVSRRREDKAIRVQGRDDVESGRLQQLGNRGQIAGGRLYGVMCTNCLLHFLTLISL